MRKSKKKIREFVKNFNIKLRSGNVYLIVLHTSGDIEVIPQDSWNPMESDALFNITDIRELPEPSISWNEKK